MTVNYPTIPESYLGPGAYPPTFEVQRHLVSFLRWQFSKLPPGAYHWDDTNAESPDQSGSEVFITTESPLGVEKVGKRPAIQVSRAAAQAQGYGFANNLYTDPATGKATRLDLLPTHLMVNVLSTVPVEAERIAFFCFERIFALREAIVASLPCLLSIGANIGIPPPMPAGSLIDQAAGTAKWYVVQLSVPTFIQYANTAEPLNKRILGNIATRTTA